MTSMKQMNQALHIRLGAMYWMDWKCEANEKARPMQVVVDSVYPHVIIVKDSRGKKIGIPAASAALDLRLTRELPSRSPKEPTQKKIPLPARPGKDHQRIPGREKRPADCKRNGQERCVREPYHQRVEKKAGGSTEMTEKYIDVWERKRVPQDCSTCMYLSCDYIHCSKDDKRDWKYIREIKAGRKCEEYEMDDYRFIKISRKRGENKWQQDFQSWMH